MVYIRWDQWTHTTHTHTTTEDRDGNIPQARPRSAHPGEVLDTPWMARISRASATMQILGDCCRCGTDAGFATNGLPSIIASTTHTHPKE